MVSSGVLERVLPNAVSPALFALSRYMATPSDAKPVAQLLQGLLAERAGLAPVASASLAAAAAELEEQYELQETEAVAHAYVTANVNLGRAGLAAGYVTGAHEACEAALALLDDESSDADDAETRRLRAQALLGRGLTAWHREDLTAARKDLEDVIAGALGETEQEMADQGRILLARVLFAAGEASRAQALLQDVGISDKAAAQSANATLAAVAVLSDNDSSVGAALTSWQVMPLRSWAASESPKTTTRRAPRQVVSSPGASISRFAIERHREGG